MNTQEIMDKINQFYSWLYSSTGLNAAQVLVIGLSIVFVLTIFLFYQRRARLKAKRTVHHLQRPEIIGSRLSSEHSKNIHSTNIKHNAPSDYEEQEKSWGQSTKQWRMQKEKIMKLQHDIGKYQRTEKSLNEKISKLETENKKLQSDISKLRKVEDELKQQINELMNSNTKQTGQDKVELSKNDNALSDSNGYNNQIEDAEIDSAIPLDIHELSAIADLAKRVQSKVKQHQAE